MEITRLETVVPGAGPMFQQPGFANGEEPVAGELKAALFSEMFARQYERTARKDFLIEPSFPEPLNTESLSPNNYPESEGLPPLPENSVEGNPAPEPGSEWLLSSLVPNSLLPNPLLAKKLPTAQGDRLGTPTHLSPDRAWAGTESGQQTSLVQPDTKNRGEGTGIAPQISLRTAGSLESGQTAAVIKGGQARQKLSDSLISPAAPNAIGERRTGSEGVQEARASLINQGGIPLEFEEGARLRALTEPATPSLSSVITSLQSANSQPVATVHPLSSPHSLQTPLVSINPDKGPEVIPRPFTFTAEAPVVRLGQKLIQMVSRGESSIEIRLDPPELGRLTLSLTVEGEALSLQATASSNGARDLLMTHGDRLRQALAEQGMSLDGLSVNVSAEQQQHHSKGQNTSLAEASSETPAFADWGGEARYFIPASLLFQIQGGRLLDHFI